MPNLRCDAFTGQVPNGTPCPRAVAFVCVCARCDRDPLMDERIFACSLHGSGPPFRETAAPLLVSVHQRIRGNPPELVHIMSAQFDTYSEDMDKLRRKLWEELNRDVAFFIERVRRRIRENETTEKIHPDVLSRALAENRLNAYRSVLEDAVGLFGDRAAP